MKEAMSSLSSSSSGTVVSVPMSVSSSSPPSSEGARIQCLVALSVSPARSHSSLAGELGRSVRVIYSKISENISQSGFCFGESSGF